MAMKTTFLVQTFVIKRKRLVPGDREVAPTESGLIEQMHLTSSRAVSSTSARDGVSRLAVLV